MAQIHLRHGRRSSRFSRLATGIPWPPLRIATGNLLRTPLVSLVTVLSVAAGFSLTAAFFLSYSNVMTTSTDSVARHEWDVMVDFERPVTTGEAETLMGDHGVRRQQWTPYVKTVVQGATAGTRTLSLWEGSTPRTTGTR